MRRNGVCSCRLFAKREAKRLPYKRDFIQRRRAGAMFAKQTCHGAKRSMLASRRNVVCTIFWIHTNEWISLDLGRGGACSSRRNVVCNTFRLRTNKRSPTNSVGGDVLDAPKKQTARTKQYGGAPNPPIHCRDSRPRLSV